MTARSPLGVRSRLPRCGSVQTGKEERQLERCHHITQEVHILIRQSHSPAWKRPVRSSWSVAHLSPMRTISILQMYLVNWNGAHWWLISNFNNQKREGFEKFKVVTVINEVASSQLNICHWEMNRRLNQMPILFIYEIGERQTKIEIEWNKIGSRLILKGHYDVCYAIQGINRLQ